MLTFDNSPTIYWLLGYILAGLVILSSRYRKLPDLPFLIGCLVTVMFMRFPVVVFNRELNPDESQMLSHAITLFQDPVYWRSVDGTTIGPLDNYLLVVPKLLGLQINYTTGRLMGLVCTVGSLSFLFLTLRNWLGATVARVVICAPVLLLAFTQEVDFVHYSSEQVPVLLLALATWLLSRIDIEKTNHSINAFSLGLVAGMVPFAKLQAVPLAGVIALAAFWLYFVRTKIVKDFKPLMLLVAGVITFPLLVTLWALTFHVLDDLIDFYILGNAIYAGGASFSAIPFQFIKIFSLSIDFQVFSLALAFPVCVGIASLFSSGDEKVSRDLAVIILLLVASSVYAVTKSGNDFIHYLNFCIAPWTLLAGIGATRLKKWTIAFPVLLLLCFAGSDAFSFIKYRKLNDFYSVNARSLAESPVVAALKKYKKEGDYMVVWGWQCAYYVEAQLAQGTAENHSERSIFAHPMRDTYRDRYLSDLARTKPAFILDAVGKNSFWVQNKTTQGIESDPELSVYVKSYYKRIGDFDGTELYIRNDRVN
jgi:hypothetical protein